MSSYISYEERHALSERVSRIAGTAVETWIENRRVHMRVAEPGTLVQPRPIDRSVLRDLAVRFSYRVAGIIARSDKRYLVFGHTDPNFREFFMIGSLGLRPLDSFEKVRDSRSAIGEPGSSMIMEFDDRIVAPAILLP